MKNSNIQITVCVKDFPSKELMAAIKEEFVESFKTDNVIVLGGFNSSDVIITNLFTMEVSRNAN